MDIHRRSTALDAGGLAFRHRVVLESLTAPVCWNGCNRVMHVTGER